MAACGGGGGNNNGGSSITSVSVSCNPATVQSGQTSQCSASVSGTGNFSSVVTWSASAGSINSSGLFTAPATNATLLVSITATSTQDSSKSGTATVTVNPATTANNMLPIVVDAGPAQDYVNGAFASVTICAPNTTNCQTIDHLLVDTGSSGVRIISSVLTLSLPQQIANGNLVTECMQFSDGIAWGHVAMADIQLAGEKASSVPGSASQGVPVQVIGTSVVPIPQSCSAKGTPQETVQALGAKGILGVGLFEQDCGSFCTNNADPNFPFYYTCNGGTCTQTTQSLVNQVQNPVWLFPQDNNGVLISLPSVQQGTGAANVNGSLIFGVDTQGNNALGSAKLYTTTADGNFQKLTFNSKDYVNNCSTSTKGTCLYPDSGSNALFILDASTLGVSRCSGGNSSFYCQNPTKNFTATNVGMNGTSADVQFSIGDANSLFSNNPNSTAFVELGGPNPGSFDYGLPFFYGRPVFTIIETKSTSKGTGPAWAY